MNARTLPILGGLAFGALILANASLFTVSETQQAITLQFGQPKNFFNIDGRVAKLLIAQSNTLRRRAPSPPSPLPRWGRGEIGWLRLRGIEC